VKTLFDPKGHFAEGATELDSRAGAVLVPIFNEFLARGYSAREIENVLIELVFEISLESRIQSSDTLEGEGPDGYGRK